MRTGGLDNMALSFAYKWFPAGSRPLGLFYYTGMAALGRTAGAFWDKDNSLLASLILSDQRMYRARLNVYPPPAMSARKLKPGFFLGYGRNREAYLGISLNLAPLGLSGL